MELKLRWTKYCVYSVAGTDNVDGNDSDNVILLLKAQNYMSLK